METLQYIIPCKHCRRSYSRFIERNPIAFESPSTPSKWLWKCKDQVNQKLRKPYKNFPDVQRRYTTFHALTSETAILDLLVIMSMECDDKNAPHLLEFASTVGHLVAHMFGGAFSSRLRICSESIKGTHPVTAEEVRQTFECMLSDYIRSHTGGGILSVHSTAVSS